MRSRKSRHLEPVLLGDLGRAPAFALAGPAGDTAKAGPDTPPPEFNWHDYAAMLLHVAAEIEHALMVQYLFAAYSLGGPQVPDELRDDVRGWQETILGIAKEEMGHLVTVQNLLTGLRAPLNLDREDYPWGTPFYPFDFTLERLTLDSLATYVCAESPEGWTGPEADEIRQRAQAGAGGPVNRVGVLYDTIKAVIEDRSRVPDTAFDAASVPHQASWDEWGRGYREGARGHESSNVSDIPAPDLLILEVGSRDDALNALAEIGEQGESPEPLTTDDPTDAGEESHFMRFLNIYRAIAKLDPSTQDRVSRYVLSNPTTDRIVVPETKAWAHLFNLRYRMLLVNLAHAFELADTPAGEGTVNARGGLVNRTFREMYNLRAIAGILVELDAEGSSPEGPRAAGPPFQMPYTLDLPRHERDRWALHCDLLKASATQIGELAPMVEQRGLDYLEALLESDRVVYEQLERLA